MFKGAMQAQKQAKGNGKRTHHQKGGTRTCI